MNNNLKKIFDNIYLKQIWKHEESVSGPGSELRATIILRKKIIPEIIDITKAKSFLDIPCGDFNYMKEVNFNCEYTGADICDKIIKNNTKKYPNAKFICLDLTSDTIPKSDIVFTRDCLVHLSLEDCLKAIDNIVSSGSKYLAITSFPNCNFNEELPNFSWRWRTLNMEIEPFNFKRMAIFNEGFLKDKYKDKSVLLTRIN